jgi:hypothetical protein
MQEVKVRERSSIIWKTDFFILHYCQHLAAKKKDYFKLLTKHGFAMVSPMKLRWWWDD